MKFIPSLLRLARACCLATSGCESLPHDIASVPDEPEFRSISAGSGLTRIALTRVQRTSAALSGRAATIAGAMAGTSCSATQAASWATAALVKRDYTKLGRPFSCGAHFQVAYKPYIDWLRVTDTRSISPPPSELYQSPGAPRPARGIGKAQARGIATNFFAQHLVPSGLVDSSWGLMEYRILVDATHSETGRSGSRIRIYTFGFRRRIAGVPLLDTLLEIGVDSMTGQIRDVGIGDVSSTVVGTSTSVRSEADAIALFEQEADAMGAQYDDEIVALVSKLRTVYLLPDAMESITTTPVMHGVIVFEQGVSMSRAETATVSFVDAQPNLSVDVPWAGEPEPVALPNGGWCGDDTECASGHCYGFEGYYGVCGHCSSGADCAQGCNPPNPGAQPVKPSVCGNGSVGSGCDSTGDCSTGLSCAAVKAGARGYVLRTCSSCTSDAQCGTGSRCAPHLDWTNGKGYLKCVANSSLSLGAVCSVDTSCASGRCATHLFPDGSEVGVCSACKTNSQCSSGSCKLPTFAVGAGFGPGTCN